MDEGIDPLAFRYLCLGAHYRGHLNFSWSTLQGASAALNRLREKVFELPVGGEADPDFVQRFMLEVNRDLNTPNALALTWDLLKSRVPDACKRATLAVFDKILGLRLEQWRPEVVEAVPEPVRALLEARAESRASKDWERSDAMRAEIERLGFMIADGASETRIKRR
jgi:cysteinyl-tRNA synthetase